MWIIKEEKNLYCDSKLRGIRLWVQKDVLLEIREEVKTFLSWLRENYFFPIRCTIKLKHCPYFSREGENDKDSYGDFYYDKNDKKYPEIWIAAGRIRRETLENRKKRILFLISHELTHYFQWYFFEFEKRTDRSLEIEANKWARYLLQEFYDGKDLRNSKDKCSKNTERQKDLSPTV